jgi:hypothetical protein
MNWLIEEGTLTTKGVMLSCPLMVYPSTLDRIDLEVDIQRYMSNIYENDNLADKGKVYVMDVHLALHNLGRLSGHACLCSINCVYDDPCDINILPLPPPKPPPQNY